MPAWFRGVWRLHLCNSRNRLDCCSFFMIRYRVGWIGSSSICFISIIYSYIIKISSFRASNRAATKKKLSTTIKKNFFMIDNRRNWRRKDGEVHLCKIYLRMAWDTDTDENRVIVDPLGNYLIHTLADFSFVFFSFRLLVVDFYFIFDINSEWKFWKVSTFFCCCSTGRDQQHEKAVRCITKIGRQITD